MSCVRTEAHNQARQDVVEQFWEFLEIDDVTGAEKFIEHLQDLEESVADVPGVDVVTIAACQNLLKQHIETESFWNQENYLNNRNMHV